MGPVKNTRPNGYLESIRKGTENVSRFRGVYYGSGNRAADIERLKGELDTSDAIVIGAEPEKRPMWKWIEDSDRYKKEYHRAMDGFITSYFGSGEFEKEIGGLREMLLPYVEKDPTAFYSADRFLSSSDTLKKFCLLRAESIRRQLDGKLSADRHDQSADDRVDASGFTMDDLS